MARIASSGLYITPKALAKAQIHKSGKTQGGGASQARAMLDNRLGMRPKGVGGGGGGMAAYGRQGQMQYQQMNRGGGGRFGQTQRSGYIRPQTMAQSMNQPIQTQQPSAQSPRNNLLDIDYTSVGGVDPAKIDQVMDYYLSEGLSPQGAAYLTGSLIQESRLDPNAIGDSGTAHGLNQWRFDRLEGLPSDFMGQVEFSLTEMDRDAIARQHGTSRILRDPNASTADIQRAIERWTRWGHLGDRWNYGAQLADQLGY